MKRKFSSTPPSQQQRVLISSSNHDLNYFKSLFICIILMMVMISGSGSSFINADNNLAASYRLDTIAGGNLGDGFSGSQTPIGHPHAIAFLPRIVPTPLVNPVEDERPQDLIIIDGLNNLIRKLTYNWTGQIVEPEQEIFNVPTFVSTLAGVASSQPSSDQAVTDGLPANTVKLTNPNTVTVSLLTGDIFFVDSNTIKKININGTLSTLAFNAHQQQPLCSDAVPSPLNNAQLSSPSQIVYSLEGVEEFIYIVDTKNSRIRKLSLSNNTITTIAGKCGQEGYYGNGINATDALLSQPTGIALFRIEDSPINSIPSEIYIADQFYIRKIVNGIITTVAGTGPGIPTQSNLLPALNVTIAPTSIAVGEEGEVYFLEQAQHRLRMFNPMTNTISVVAGTGLNVGPLGDGGLATMATLNHPSFIAVSSEEIIVADCMNNRIRKISEEGIITTIFGNGQETYLGDNGPAVLSGLSPNHVQAVQQPNGGGADIVTIADGKNNRVRRINQQGIISTIIGSEGAANSNVDLDGQLASVALISNPSASFYVSSTNETYFNMNNVIYKILSNGVIKRVVGGVSNTYAGDNQSATLSILSHPTSVFASKTTLGRIYIADSGNNRIRMINESTGIISTIAANLHFPISSVYEFANDLYFTDATQIGKISPDGLVTIIAGQNVTGYNGNNISATDALLNHPNGLQITQGGDIYFADSGNNRIRKISNGIITLVSGNGQPTFAGDGSKACCASLNGPTSLSISSTGEMFIVDSKNDRIRKIGLDGNITTLVQVQRPTSIVISSSDEIFIAHSNFVSKYVSGSLQLIAGTDSINYFNGDGLATRSSLNSPSSLSLDSLNNIYIADSGNDRVRKISSTSIYTVAGGIGDGLPATEAILSGVSSFVVSSLNEIYIADNVANRIRKVSTEGIIQTIAGTYEYGFNGDNILATAASLANPTSVSLSSEGEVFISDFANHRIRKVSNEGIISTIVSGSEQDTSVHYPHSVTVSPRSDFIIICNGDSRITRFNLKEENATVVTLAGVASLNGFNGETIADAKLAYLNRPLFADISPADGSTIYIADSGNNRIRKLTASCPKGYRLNDAAECEKLPRICYGLLPSNETVCSGNGICESYNNCSCNAGYYGDQCEFYGCGGIPSDGPTVCSSNGVCVSANNCTCNPGYYGENCEHFDCFGIEHSNPTVCSASGVCTLPNKCECRVAHHGDYCQLFTCYGKESNDTGVCSGHGACSSGNNCTCQPGYYGNECDSYGCHGVAHNDAKVCSGHGACEAIDTCNCTQGYNGSNCDLYYCYGIEHADVGACSSNGHCSGPNQCACNEAYHGQTCELMTCFGKLSNDSTVCSGNGVCSSGNNCTCQNGYSGKECQLYSCFGVLKSDQGVCSGHGLCSSFNNCTCNAGYIGDNCEQFNCFGVVHNATNVCSGNGACTQPNQCECKEGYQGQACDLMTCFGVLSNDSTVCSGHGICSSGNNCTCHYGYEGENCETFSCNGLDQEDPQVCSGNGICSSFNNCTCNAGFSGINCDQFNCFGVAHNASNVCSSNGICIQPNQCECKEGYQGQTCDLMTCFGILSNDSTVCSGHGICSTGNNCTCHHGYEGESCETFSCNGLEQEDPQVCSGHGICSSFNNCTCNAGFSGINCEHFYCYGVHHSDPNVCSGNGACTQPNICTCNYGYSGSQCGTNIICQPGDQSLFCSIANNTALKNFTETNILLVEDMEDMESFNITFAKFKDIFITLPTTISDYLENILRDDEIALNMLSSVSDIRSINSKVLSPLVTFVITQQATGARVQLTNLPQPILLNMHNIVIPQSSLTRDVSALSTVVCAYYDKTTDSWKTDRVTTTILSSQQGVSTVTYSVQCSTTHWPSSFALISQPVTPTASSGKNPQPGSSPTKPVTSKKPSTSSSNGTVITEKGDMSYIVVLVGFILIIIIAIVIGVGYYIYKKKQRQQLPTQNDGNGQYATLNEEP